MSSAVRTVIVGAIVIIAATAALAIAATGRYPGAKQIPTVVTSQQATQTVEETPRADSDSSALPLTVAPPAPAPSAPAPAPSGQQGGASTAPEQASPEIPPADSDSLATDPDGDHEIKREVVIPLVRDYDDESSSASSENGEGTSKPTSPDFGSDSSNGSGKKD